MKKLSIIFTFNTLVLVLLLSASLVYHCVVEIKIAGCFSLMSSTHTNNRSTETTYILPSFPSPLLAKEIVSNYKPHS